MILMKIKDVEYLKYKVKVVAIMIVINCINFLCLQISSQTVWDFFSLKPLYAFVNIGIIFAVVYLFYACINKLWVSEAVCSGICVTYSVINVYVVEFHGTPLTIPEFRNTGTALRVLNGYSFIVIKPLVFIFVICILFFITCFLINKLKKTERFLINKCRSKKYVRIVYFLFSSIYIIGILQINGLIQPLQKGWHFKTIVGQYGYPLYFLASGLEYKIDEPKGYSEENVAAIQLNNYFNIEEDNTQTPDIILILNESFYDLSIVANIETDMDYMEAFWNMKNSISGYTIVPKIGGGTNNSEWELLTSNSTYLLKGITPFQVLDMSDGASIVSNLKELGYYTIGMHPSASSNYARNAGYPRMGFDEIHFENDFENKGYYGNRKLVTDVCAYEHMIQWYENAIQKQGKKPIFSYLLTIQNHGDWNTNSQEDDIVHVIQCDNAAYEEKLNEYLSCISLSVDALCDLMTYFENIDRPVIICMVGDHAPSFIGDIADNDSAILQRATPFIIWANFPIEEKKEVMISMNQLGPILLNTAGVKMIPYFQFLLQLGKEIPIITSYGSVIDKTGNIYSCTEDSEYSKSLQEYFWLEYNNLQEVSLDKWFSIQ